VNGEREPEPRGLRRMVRAALREDVGGDDITTRLTVDPDRRCRAVLLAKCDGVLSGVMPFWMVFDELGAEVDIERVMVDGAPFAKGDNVTEFTGIAQRVLTGERTALNFLQHLTGVATLTSRYVAAVAGLPVRITDTRKTTPLFRRMEKEAVAHGGGHNHRHALYDGILIKDNHIRAAGGVGEAVRRAKAGAHHLMKIEVEVTTLDECDEALAAGAEAILLDNMDSATMRKAVAKGANRGVTFEASGGVTLDTVRAIAETGVQVISVGALTHSAPAADVSLEIELLD
jgi:nicotinate-nucleotide pyrophosphorylase (carboxylating)